MSLRGILADFGGSFRRNNTNESEDTAAKSILNHDLAGRWADFHQEEAPEENVAGNVQSNLLAGVIQNKKSSGIFGSIFSNNSAPRTDKERLSTFSNRTSTTSRASTLSGRSSTFSVFSRMSSLDSQRERESTAGSVGGLRESNILGVQEEIEDDMNIMLRQNRMEEIEQEERRKQELQKIPSTKTALERAIKEQEEEKAKRKPKNPTGSKRGPNGRGPNRGGVGETNSFLGRLGGLFNASDFGSGVDSRDSTLNSLGSNAMFEARSDDDDGNDLNDLLRKVQPSMKQELRKERKQQKQKQRSSETAISTPDSGSPEPILALPNRIKSAPPELATPNRIVSMELPSVIEMNKEGDDDERPNLKESSDNDDSETSINTH